MLSPFGFLVGLLERSQCRIQSHRIPAMASGNHRLSMDEYKQLSELLRKAEQDGRLGEAMVFSGLADKVEPALNRYQNSLNGPPLRACCA